MKILRGRYAGQTADLHQFANDWMMVDIHGGTQGVVVRPDQVKLDPDEGARMRFHAGVGTFWREWRLNDDGTFTRLKPMGD